MLKECVSHVGNVRVEHFRGLLADYVKAPQADVIVKGLRVVSDFESEMSTALMNRSLSERRYAFPDVRSKLFVRQLEPRQRSVFSRRRRRRACSRTRSAGHDGKRAGYTNLVVTEVEMSVYRVLDKLEAYVHEGTWLPAGYRVLSEERLVEFVEKIRSSLPEEVGRAKIIAKDQERVLRDAQEKAQAIVDERPASTRSCWTSTRSCSVRARPPRWYCAKPKSAARKIREGADPYAAQVLAEMESRLAGALGSVRKGRQALAGQSTDARPSPRRNRCGCGR